MALLHVSPRAHTSSELLMPNARCPMEMALRTSERAAAFIPHAGAPTCITPIRYEAAPQPLPRNDYAY